MQTITSLGRRFRHALTMRGEEPARDAKAVPGALSSLGLKSRMGIGNVANVLDYGADPTGATSSSEAFNRAWEAAPLIYRTSGEIPPHLDAGRAKQEQRRDYWGRCGLRDHGYRRQLYFWVWYPFGGDL